jgi:pimeloyl-ACP methyl ester carboxylesterase
MAARMAALMPNAQCRILPELRHMALAEDPQSTLSQLLPFLANALTPGT